MFDKICIFNFLVILSLFKFFQPQGSENIFKDFEIIY